MRMWSAIIVVIVVGTALVAIWVGQRRLIYFPDRRVPTPAAMALAAVQPVEIPVGPGLTLRGWFLTPVRGQAVFTVVVFNGNAGNRAYRAPLAAALQARGLNVLLFDYRGFGDSDGDPDERGLAADAQAVHAFLTRRQDVRGDRLVYFGESLGTGVAVRLAADRPPAALVLRSPFTSLVDVGRFHYPFLPVRWLLRDRFASIDTIRRVASPVLIIAGGRDSIVPVEQSRRLYDAVTTPKRLVVIENADHNDSELLAGAGLLDAVTEFLAAR